MTTRPAPGLPPRPRRHGALFWSAILLALGALVGGSVVAYVTYAATAGADGAVKGYFAALQRADAPAALGFGDLPAGPTQLLTSSVLRAQRAVAPIRHVEIVSSDESGDTATVRVRYRLDFATGSRLVDEAVPVIRHNGSWRLARTAATTELHLRQAADRATIMGGRLPDGALLIFPGAVPIKFDSPYLRLSATSAGVELGAKAESDLTVQLTPAGRTAVLTAVELALRGCLGGSVQPDPRCPLPGSRAVPGTLRATVSAAGVQRTAVVTLAASSTGAITISGTIKLKGRYTVLDFENQPVAKSATVSLPLAATTYPTYPISIVWARDT